MRWLGAGERVLGHTPGPWKVSSYRPDRIIARDPREGTYNFGDDKVPTLATVERTDDFCRDLANTRLIAASPRLYDFVSSRAEQGDAEAERLLIELYLYAGDGGGA